jgi:hypothetical protein
MLIVIGGRLVTISVTCNHICHEVMQLAGADSQMTDCESQAAPAIVRIVIYVALDPLQCA